jgi:hypothetical protein
MAKMLNDWEIIHWVNTSVFRNPVLAKMDSIRAGFFLIARHIARD